MVEIDIKAIGIERTKKTFLELAKRVSDMTPIWKDFRDFYQQDMMPKSFGSKGALMEGGRWHALTPAYRKWKQKSGYSQELMKLTGKMYNAATGGAGWSDKIGKKDMTMEVKGEDYYYFTQHRKTNPRFWFYTSKEDLPNKAWTYLVKITDEYLEEVDK